MTDVDLYINWALHAVLGKLSEADALMRVVGDNIRRVAAVLRVKRPIAPAPIYRGVLLDPSLPMKLDPRLTFLSWSEDRDVACWFASPSSTISEDAIEHNPSLRGFVYTLDTAPLSVLFHHSWAQEFGGLAVLALLHPYMGAEGARQIEWALRTQREVITEPVALPVAEPIANYAVCVESLETRLTPPWVERTVTS